MTTLLFRALGLLAGLTLALSACSSDETDSLAEADETTTSIAPTTTEASTTTSEAAADDRVTDDEAMVDDDEVATDDETMVEETEDVAVADDTESTEESVDPDTEPIDTDTESGTIDAELEQILPLFGITDVPAAAECIASEADKDGTTVSEAVRTEAIIVGIIRCARDDVRDSLGADFVEVDSSSIAATPEQIECSFESLLDSIASLDMSTAGDMLSGDAPDEVVSKLSDDCGISTADAEFLLNDA